MKLEHLYDIGSRDSFNKTWLSEMPSGVGTFETYDAIKYSIVDFIKHGIKPISVFDNIKKIDSGDRVFYWYGSDNDIQLAVEFHKQPEALVVTLTGKRPDLRGKAPFASDLYSVALKDSNKNIRVMSDSQLSDEGFALWKKMVALGHKVSVYDAKNPGITFKSFETPDELDKYFMNDDTDFMRYQFVLSENMIRFCSMRASFNLRNLRESNGLALKDLDS